MRITQTHVRFWQSRRPMPAWAKTTPIFEPITVHDCINAHAGIRFKHLEAGNTMNLLRFVIKRKESLSDYLASLARKDSWCSRNLPRRAAYARRWLARLTK